MTKTYAQLTRQIETLTAQAEKQRRKETAGVVERIKSAIAIYGLTAEDLGLAPKQAKASSRAAKRPAVTGKRAKRGKAARPVKFRNEAGQVWSGRGPRPHSQRDALQNGKDLKDFAV
jgi:DNA-binding protein H-NS